MAKRGVFAEMNHQAQRAEKRRRQERAAAFRAQASADKRADQARSAAERARAAASRADAAQQKAAEKEAARLYAESRVAQVESMNALLARDIQDIDSLLAWTLDFDDFVDVAGLKVEQLAHPRFSPGPLAVPAPPVPEPDYPSEPVYQEPPAPKGLASAFGGKMKHQEAVQQTRGKHDAAVKTWHEAATAQHAQYVSALQDLDRVEAFRVSSLAKAQATYEHESRAREAEAATRNEELTKLVNELAFDVESAIEEYAGIVLANSVYPDGFPVSHDHAFDLLTRELTVTALVPEPSTVPAVKEYRYVKGKDEIVPSMLPVKAQKDRYAGAIWQVAVRTMHEVFEADRTGKIHSVSLTVGVPRPSPATGAPETVPLVLVAADRDGFGKFDLANVVPRATLAHLGAALSKSPFDLTPADVGRGVRARTV